MVGTETFMLPASLEAHEPPEARGLERDDVRMMVSFTGDDSIVHTRFSELPSFLRASDVLVVNTSATLNAALAAQRPNGERILLHLSQRVGGERWVVELRRVADTKTTPLLTARAGERLELAGG